MYNTQKKKIKNLARKYVHILEQAGMPIQEAYLYGSHANGKAHKDSDIDICVVSKQYNFMDDEIIALLWDKIRQVDYRIEPYGFTPEDFRDKSDPMVNEIKKTGIRIV